MSEQKKTENKYKKGKIYKLVSFQTDKVYVGSTCQTYLSNRFAGHRRDYKAFQQGKLRYITSFELLKYTDCDLVLIENYSCGSQAELHARERYWIETLDCVNKVIPTRTDKEYQQTDKARAYQKGYRENNKDQIKEKLKSKITCECGSIFRYSDRGAHLKTAKHISYIRNKE